MKGDVSIRINHGIWATIKKIAVKDKRSVKATVERLAEEAIAAEQDRAKISIEE